MLVASERRLSPARLAKPTTARETAQPSAGARSDTAWHRLATASRVSRREDPAEREADRVADAVLRGETVAVRGAAAGASVHRMCSACEEEQRKQQEAPVQAKRDSGSPGALAGNAASLSNLDGHGQPLPVALLGELEPRFGYDFRDVRVHTDAHAGDSARAFDALAYTYGRHVVFGAGQFDPSSAKGRRLIAHELAHVVQQRATGASLQRKEGDDQDPPKMSVSGDAERKSPSGGVAIANGKLEWDLKYIGKDTEVTQGTGMQFNMVLGKDVEFNASFTPTAGASSCPTITFMQSVQPTIGGLWDTGPLLYTRSPATGASVDVKYDASQPDTAPFYGLKTGTGSPGLKAAPNLTVAGTGAGASPAATHADAPYRRQVPKGTTAMRSFETAVICAETADTFGSIDWGYTKTGAGVVTLTGATPKDVRTMSASSGFETTRQAFYSGFFQLSLSGFATGSSSLTTAQKTSMDGIDTKDLTRVILVGANDNSGGPEAKADLSLKRAEAARDYLVQNRKVASSLIRVEGHGVEARVPNPPGQDVPANRRVDVHLQRGAETVKPANARLGSAAERKRPLQQNPRLTVDEAVDTIVRLDSTTGRVSTAEWSELNDMLGALDGWRAVDPTVPDLRQIYAAALKRIGGRAQVYSAPQRPPFPQVGPISPEVDEALRKYEEAKKRLEDLKRERDEALRRLDEEAGLSEEQ